MSSDVVHHRLAGNLAVQMHTLAAMIVNEKDHKLTVYANQGVRARIKAYLVARGHKKNSIKCVEWPAKEPEGVVLRFEPGVSQIRSATDYGLQQTDGIVFVTTRRA